MGYSTSGRENDHVSRKPIPNPLEELATIALEHSAPLDAALSFFNAWGEHLSALGVIGQEFRQELKKKMQVLTLDNSADVTDRVMAQMILDCILPALQLIQEAKERTEQLRAEYPED